MASRGYLKGGAISETDGSPAIPLEFRQNHGQPPIAWRSHFRTLIAANRSTVFGIIFAIRPGGDFYP